MIQTISSITPERMVWWRTVNSQWKHPDEGFLLNFFWKTLNFYGIYGTYVLLVLYTAQFCCGISECQMGHAMVKCAKLFERKEQAGALLDIPYHMLYLTRHTIPYYKLCLTRHTTPYYTLCLTSRDAILGHKSVSVDRDTRTEARCDTGLCNTCDTVTHRGHLLPMLTSRQICRALGSRINKNLSSARIADQQDGYRDSPAMPALSKPRGIWMSNPQIILESSFIISNTLCLILVLVSICLSMGFGSSQWVSPSSSLWTLRKCCLSTLHFPFQQYGPFPGWMPADCWNLHQNCVSGFGGISTCDIIRIYDQHFTKDDCCGNDDPAFLIQNIMLSSLNIFYRPPSLPSSPLWSWSRSRWSVCLRKLAWESH